MKIWMKACVLALTVMLLAGCSQQTSSAEPIGIDAAKAVALEDAGVSAESVSSPQRAWTGGGTRSTMR